MRRIFEIAAILLLGVLLMAGSTNVVEDRRDLGMEDGAIAFQFLGRTSDPDILFLSMLAYSIIHGERRSDGYLDGYLLSVEDRQLPHPLKGVGL